MNRKKNNCLTIHNLVRTFYFHYGNLFLFYCELATLYSTMAEPTSIYSCFRYFMALNRAFGNVAVENVLVKSPYDLQVKKVYVPLMLFVLYELTYLSHSCYIFVRHDTSGMYALLYAYIHLIHVVMRALIFFNSKRLVEVFLNLEKQREFLTKSFSNYKLTCPSVFPQTMLVLFIILPLTYLGKFLLSNKRDAIDVALFYFSCVVVNQFPYRFILILHSMYYCLYTTLRDILNVWTVHTHCRMSSTTVNRFSTMTAKQTFYITRSLGILKYQVVTVLCFWMVEVYGYIGKNPCLKNFKVSTVYYSTIWVVLLSSLLLVFQLNIEMVSITLSMQIILNGTF